MKKVVVVFLLVFFLNGCYPWEINRENLNKIEIGMTKDQVRQIMGKPYRREAESNLEWWLYDTQGGRGMYFTESEYLTPLLFEDGKLVGWGKNFWTTKERKYDIKIDQRVKQE